MLNPLDLLDTYRCPAFRNIAFWATASNVRVIGRWFDITLRPMTLEVRQTGERSAGNRRAAFDVTGDGNVTMVAELRASRKRWNYHQRLPVDRRWQKSNVEAAVKATRLPVRNPKQQKTFVHAECCFVVSKAAFHGAALGVRR